MFLFPLILPKAKKLRFWGWIHGRPSGQGLTRSQDSTIKTWIVEPFVALDLATKKIGRETVWRKFLMGGSGSAHPESQSFMKCQPFFRQTFQKSECHRHKKLSQQKTVQNPQGGNKKKKKKLSPATSASAIATSRWHSGSSKWAVGPTLGCTPSTTILANAPPWTVISHLKKKTVGKGRDKFLRYFSGFFVTAFWTLHKIPRLFDDCQVKLGSLLPQRRDSLVVANPWQVANPSRPRKMEMG